MDAEFRQEVITLAKTLDQMDYYQILRISQRAFTNEIKNAYYRQSRAFHPDKFFSEDPKITAMIHKIFKRINEAYKVLSDPDTRAAYTRGLNSPERETLLRYHPKKLEQQKKGGPEDEGQTTMGKKYYLLAKTSIQNKDYKSARINLQLALKMEANNQTFQARLKEVEELLQIGRKVKKN